MRYRYRFYTNVQNMMGNEPQRLDEVTHFRGFLPSDRVTLSHEGEVECDTDLLSDAASKVSILLNMDDRPTAETCPSASVGDVIVLDTPDGPVGFALEHEGFALVFEPANVDERPYLVIRHEMSR